VRRYRFDDDLLGLSGVPVRLWMSNVVSLKLGYGRWEVAFQRAKVGGGKE